MDASNGMAGKMVPELFADTELEIVPLNFEIGRRLRPPAQPAAGRGEPAAARKAVIQHKADLGVCFDGDADRCVFVDDTGQPVRSDLMTALLARHFLKLNPGAMVVYDLRSSRVVSRGDQAPPAACPGASGSATPS